MYDIPSMCHCNYTCILHHFRVISSWKISQPWSLGLQSFTLWIYAWSVNRWNLQTRAYHFAADTMGLCSLASTQPAPGKIYSIQGSRSWKIIEIGTNWKSTCNFLLFFYCNYMPVIYRFWDITITWLKISIFRRLYPPQKWKLASKN